jgi:choline dehydrogenase-like flavoprotein
VPQEGLYNCVMDYPRGRVLGGTSVLNYTVFVRGNAADYDGWAQRGNLGPISSVPSPTLIIKTTTRYGRPSCRSSGIHFT